MAVVVACTVDVAGAGAVASIWYGEARLNGAHGSSSLQVGLRLAAHGIGGASRVSGAGDVVAADVDRSDANQNGSMPGATLVQPVPDGRCVSCGQPLGQWATDKLTGLPDRWRWDDEALEALRAARSQRRPAALLIVDLDDFKRVNDELGHLAGDEVLRTAAKVVRSALRSTDLAGRYGGRGGDEFLVLLPGAARGQAVAVAERIRKGIGAMRVEFEAGDGPTLSIAGRTASIGVAGGTLVRDVDLLDLLRDADRALREAKLRGRDRVYLAPRAGGSALTPDRGASGHPGEEIGARRSS